MKPQFKKMRAGWKGGRERAVEREVSLTDGYNKFDFVNLSSRISQLLFFFPKKLTQKCKQI